MGGEKNKKSGSTGFKKEILLKSIAFMFLPAIAVGLIYRYCDNPVVSFAWTIAIVGVVGIIDAILDGKAFHSGEFPKNITSVLLSSSIIFIGIHAIVDFEKLKRTVWAPPLELVFKNPEYALKTIEPIYEKTILVFGDDDVEYPIERDFLKSKRELQLPGYFHDYKQLYVKVCKSDLKTCIHSDTSSFSSNTYFDIRWNK